MNQKVLLADDSLTIQKVIKITLANQPYDIVDCSSDDELFKKLAEIKPSLVFLDFNLSEKFSGYELTSKIKQQVPSAKVLLLLGTFDTIDEAAMEKCGASDKVVKPFDSNKFIAICRHLTNLDSVQEEIKYPSTPKKEEFIVPKVEDDQWQVNHTAQSKTPEPVPEPKKEFDIRQHLNPLDQEMSEWGMSVPGIINDKESHEIKVDLPPVIGGEIKSLQNHKSKKAQPVQKEEIKFPANDDLDYPTIEQLSENAHEEVTETEARPTSNLISIDSLNHSPLEFEIEHQINSLDETDVSSIEDQIRDEVEENLWHVDEFEDLKKEVASKIEEVNSNLQPSSEFNEDESIEWNSSASDFNSFKDHSITSQDVEKLKSDIDSMIKKHVKAYMDEMFQKNVEKVSWEVIPDLAENLIRQELSKIANKILND